MPRRVMEGRVVGDKTNKTVTVLVERRIMDPLYKKFIRRSKKYAAHDETNLFRIGDAVSIEECPPISKSKRWKVISAAPTKPRDEKTVVVALAARALAEQNKPEAKKKPAKVEKPAKAKAAAPVAEPVKAAKAAVPAKTETKPAKAPAKAPASAKTADEGKATAAPATTAAKAKKKKDDQ